MGDKPFLPQHVRAILERRGILKPPSFPNPPSPKVEALVEQAVKRGFGVMLIVPEHDPYTEEKKALEIRASITSLDQTWDATDSAPAVALAVAFASAIEETEPQQGDLL